MDGVSPITYVLVGLPVGLLLFNWLSPRNLRSIPTVGGPSIPILSYLGAWQYVHHAKELFNEGYAKYKGSVFKVAMIDRWLVVVTGKRLIDELQRMPDDTVSLAEGAGELTSTLYVYNLKLNGPPYHLSIVRNLAYDFEDMYDEIKAAFDEYVPCSPTDWQPVYAMVAMRNIVARATGRVFVGLPMCRNAQYINLGVDFTLTIAKSRTFLSYFPPFLKPLAAKFVDDLEPRVQLGLKLLGPVIAERWSALDEYGNDWSEKPNDALQRLVEEARARGDGPEQIVRMLLLLNFAAISTSSNSFMHALYHVAASPELLKALREEVEPIIEEQGWTKASIGKMHKMDSFLRESQRFNGINTTTVMRKALKDVKFSNGVTVPAGNVLVAPTISVHSDEDNYTNAHLFEPFRYVEEAEGTASNKRQYVSTASDYVAFGHGKYACPGRFFAAHELKTMMAHLIINYDLKLSPEGVRPPNIYLSFSVVPNPRAKVLFKKRST